ncbi:MAG: carboxylating nicotinate-nucleotide diphosphorylase [Bacteroidia bacterium]|nr:carboxylating nicotinate-nucleotide diphosphorylase [Bacteroidia bacterium]MDW8333303.1 carboxylating nicotinate-nucleotide diphosphorylase [Bacteroidia bacterium]
MEIPDLGAIDEIIERGLTEDVGEGDFTTLATLPENPIAKAECRIKSPGILAGVEFARRVFKKVDDSVEISIHIEDGRQVRPGDVAFTVVGRAHTLLKCERLALNAMQRMSGIATETRKAVLAVRGTKARIADTRKTTPGFRLLEKWAVVIGGGVNHRFGLYDMILIKDNHSDLAGGVEIALTRALQNNPRNLPIVVEARNAEEVQKILAIGGVERILLDNMPPEIVALRVKDIDGRFAVEVSGKITHYNVRDYARAGADYISMGMLTHSYQSMDISLKTKPA